MVASDDQEQAPSRRLPYRSYFFLSYVHTPRPYDDGNGPDYWVREFFHDLCNELVAYDPTPHREPSNAPGFMDDAIPGGAKWPRRLALELATCRVFMPLYSRSYFTRENCGKEWAIFRARQMAHVAQTGTPNEAVLPVIWQPLPPERVPAFASALQIERLGVGDRYYDRGLYELIRLDRTGEYVNVVLRLAERLDEIARTAAPPPGPLADYEKVDPLFPTDADAQAGDGLERRLRITVAAPDVATLPPGRAEDFYGGRPEDWRPYAPQLDVPLAARAEDVARDLGFGAIISALNHESPEVREIGDNAVAEGPGLLLVDPWIAHEDVHGNATGTAVAEVDRRHKPWVRVLVPWSRTDRQTVEQAVRLRAGLQRMLPWSLDEWRRHTHADTRDLDCPADFGHALPDAVERAWRNYLKAGRPPGTGEYPPRPRLRGLGPGGDDGS